MMENSKNNIASEQLLLQWKTSWDLHLHNQPEQLDRMHSAQKAITTPSSIDEDSMSGVFKGSGKNPYIVTLDSCTCGDFLRRRLPCKHIYRLALELNVIAGEFDSGRNKNMLSADMFSLPVESQEILYDMCCDNIYHRVKLHVFARSDYSELLIIKGFCIENVFSPNLLETFPVAIIKSIMFSSSIEGLPKPTSQKKTLLKWIVQNYDIVFPILSRQYIFLEFTEQTDSLKRSIHQRFAKKFSHELIEDENGFSYKNTMRVFTQEKQGGLYND